MAGIRLAKLPDRTPVKLTVSLLPELQARLTAYAAFYHQTYGSEESIADLVPAMLSAFLDGDRGFARNRGGV